MPAAGGDDALGDLVAGRPGNVPVEDGDVVGVDVQQFQSGVAVTGDVRRDRLQAQTIADGFRHIGLVLDDQHAHAPMLEPPRIVGVSKTTYVLATPRSLDWMRGPKPDEHEQRPVGFDSQDPCRRRARRHRGDRRSRRLPAAGVLFLGGVLLGGLVLDGALVVDATSPIGAPRRELRDPRSERPECVAAWRGRRRRSRWHDGLR